MIRCQEVIERPDSVKRVTPPSDTAITVHALSEFLNFQKSVSLILEKKIFLKEPFEILRQNCTVTDFFSSPLTDLLERGQTIRVTDLNRNSYLSR